MLVPDTCRLHPQYPTPLKRNLPHSSFTGSYWFKVWILNLELSWTSGGPKTWIFLCKMYHTVFALFFFWTEWLWLPPDLKTIFFFYFNMLRTTSLTEYKKRLCREKKVLKENDFSYGGFLILVLIRAHYIILRRQTS